MSALTRSLHRMAGPVVRKLVGVVQLTGAVGVTGVLVAAVLLPVTGGLGLAARDSVQAFNDQPCDVEAGVPEQSSVMLAHDGSTIATFYSQNRQVVRGQPDPQGDAAGDRRDRGPPVLRAPRRRPGGARPRGGEEPAGRRDRAGRLDADHAVHQERAALPGEDAGGAARGDRAEPGPQAHRGPVRAGAGEQALQGPDPHQLPEHHLLRRRGVRRGEGGPDLLRQAGEQADRARGRDAGRPGAEPDPVRPVQVEAGREGPAGHRAQRHAEPRLHHRQAGRGGQGVAGQGAAEGQVQPQGLRERDHARSSTPASSAPTRSSRCGRPASRRTGWRPAACGSTPRSTPRSRTRCSARCRSTRGPTASRSRSPTSSSRRPARCSRSG